MRLCAVVENVSSYNVRCVSLQGRCQVTWSGGDFEESGIGRSDCFYDHDKILGNCPPTPPLCQHPALSEKSVLTMGCATDGVGWGGVQVPTMWETSLLAFIGKVPVVVCQTVNTEATFSTISTWLLCRESCFKCIFRSMICWPLLLVPSFWGDSRLVSAPNKIPLRRFGG